jgi:hypothetical protein
MGFFLIVKVICLIIPYELRQFDITINPFCLQYAGQEDAGAWQQWQQEYAQWQAQYGQQVISVIFYNPDLLP